MDDVRQAAILAAEERIVAASPKPEPEPAPVIEEPAQVVAETPAIEPPAAVVEDHDDEDEESASSDNGADPTAPRKNKGVGKRINELTREKHEERRRAETAQAEANYWREIAQKAQPQAQAAQATPSQGKPTLEQYGNDWNAYEEARDQWVIEQAHQSFAKQHQQAEEVRQQQARQAKFQERLAAFEKEVPGGWQQAVSSPVETTPVMLEAIAESDIGPKLGYYLSQHLDEALTISRLPPMQQAVAMGRIEARLLSAPPPPPRPTVTRAPPPPPAVSGANAVPAKLGGIEDHIAVVQAKRKAKFG
jgi:hypothetical protein